MKYLATLKALALAVAVSLTLVACDEEDSNPIDADPDVSAPSSLKAASADGAILLSWTASVSESASNFGSYEIAVLNKTTGTTLAPRTAAKGITSLRIDGLKNGDRYEFTVRSLTTAGKKSTGFAQLEWSPAYRQTVDAMGNVIKVYATTSTNFNSGIDLFNADKKAEVIPQSGQIFRDRGDLYVFAENNTSALSIISPDQASNKGLETQFSSVAPADADDLNAHLLGTAPATNSYTLKQFTISDVAVTTGKVYFGRLVRGTDNYYFRMLIKRGSNGKLIQGSGADRYVELVVSFQDAANVPFAKK
ncbi:MAG TPA: fibronectin type III domain-containing protein [Bacteroidota bacterium]|nr:fibronectin type III domain-containing protein [Bacteroidota bacterium]